MASPPATARRLPIFTSLAGYDRAWTRGDVIAGLTVWAVLVPEALAYASIAGVSPVVGLYAAPPALVLYAAFGSSRHLVVGPMSATAALSAAAVADLTTGGPDDVLAFTAVLALVTGVLALAAGLLRLGFLAGFISEPVLKGFIIGLALTIIIGQVPKLFGIPKEEGNFFEQLWGVLTHLGDTHGTTLVVGATSLVLVLGLRRFAPVVPGSLVAVVFGVVAVQLFDLVEHGVEIVGNIDSGLPSLGPPDGLGLSDYLERSGRGGRDHAGRLRRGTRGGEDLRGPGALRDRCQPRAGGPGRRQPRCRAVQRHGRERQPLEDSRQRLRRCPVAGLRPRGGRPHGRHAAVPHRPLRGPARGDARRGGDRGGDRAGRHRRPTWLLPALHPAPGNDLRPRGRPDFIAALAAMFGVLHLRHAPRARHRHRRVAAPPPLPLLEAPCGRARSRGEQPGPVRRPGSAPGERRRPGRAGAAGRGGPVLRQRRCGSSGHQGARGSCPG